MPEFVNVLENVGANLIVLYNNYLAHIMDVLVAPFDFVVIILTHCLHELKLNFFDDIFGDLTVVNSLLNGRVL